MLFFDFQRFNIAKTSFYMGIKAFQKTQGLTINGKYRSYVRDIISLIVLVFLKMIA